MSEEKESLLPEDALSSPDGEITDQHRSHEGLRRFLGNGSQYSSLGLRRLIPVLFSIYFALLHVVVFLLSISFLENTSLVSGVSNVTILGM